MFLILGLVLFSTVTGQGNVVEMAAGLSTRLASYICCSRRIRRIYRCQTRSTRSLSSVVSFHLSMFISRTTINI